jgi:hypothetical protein
VSTAVQPLPLSIKPRKSRKAPAIKNAVIVARAQGKPKSHIARDLGIAHNTVNAIIEESCVDKQIESGRQLSVGLIPRAIGVIEHRLSLNSENAALRVLENTIWPLQSKTSKQPDAGLTIAIQQLMGNVQIAQPASTLHNNAAEPSTSPPQQNTEVIDCTPVK